ncbi:MAG: hypothetical protein QXG00_02765 [Candidatus Woesearchaeota archaeon]
MTEINFSERFKEFFSDKKKYRIERQGISYTVFTLIIIIALEIIAYLGFLRNISGFLSHYGIWIFYLDITVVALMFALWHIFAYKTRVSCMVGMMIGMTIGMQTGILIGTIIGATNGFFTGAMTGMSLGVIVGAFAGKICGIMGVMEGLMAGVMGGTMGPMISVMMFFDNLYIFMPFFMMINLLIILCLSCMYFYEVVEGDQNIVRRPTDGLTFAVICIIVIFVLMIIMIYGHKSVAFNF